MLCEKKKKDITKWILCLQFVLAAGNSCVMVKCQGTVVKMIEAIRRKKIEVGIKITNFLIEDKCVKVNDHSKVEFNKKVNIFFWL